MNKKKTHGALKNKGAFKGILKQWGLISQAMLQGAENIDCFCDYTLTFSNVCGREGIHLVCLFFLLFVKVCAFAIACVFLCVYGCV